MPSLLRLCREWLRRVDVSPWDRWAQSAVMSTALLLRRFRRHMRRSILLGGEWGGWCCAFDCRGIIKSIPEKFVDQVAIDWGQVPVGFEELQTESYDQIPLLDGSDPARLKLTESASPNQIRRRRVQTHPPFGCGGDSLPGLVMRGLLPPPTNGTLELLPSTASKPEALASSAWALDAQETNRPGVWRLETVLRGHGGTIPMSTSNAMPSLGERTRVSVLFDVATGELAAESPHPAMPHLKPQPEVQVWQERCWSEAVSLVVMETDCSPLHIDAMDRSMRVGLKNFGEQKERPPPPAAQAETYPTAFSPTDASASTSAPSRKDDTFSKEEEADPTMWTVSLAGGVVVRGAASMLEVVLHSAEGGRIVLTRVWRQGADKGAEVAVG